MPIQIDQIVHFTLGTMFSSKQHYKFKIRSKVWKLCSPGSRYSLGLDHHFRRRPDQLLPEASSGFPDSWQARIRHKLESDR
jgi:hypothetical protein